MRYPQHLCLGMSAALLLGGFVAHADDGESGKPRRSRAAVLHQREVERAFRSNSPSPRAKVAEKLRKSGLSGEGEDVIAALAAGLRERISRNAFDAIDRELLASLARSAEAEAFLSAEPTAVKVVVLRELIDGGQPLAWERIEPLTRDAAYYESYPLRRSVVAAAELNGSNPAIEFLIETVDTADGQLKYEAATALARLTNQQFGGRAERWRTWWETARASFAAVPKAEQTPQSLSKPLDWPAPVPEFFKLPVYAGKIVFIIDRSRSMASSINGVPRINLAGDELQLAIQDMPAASQFNVLAFHDFVEPWSSRLMRASDDNRRDAILFGHRQEPMLKTACYDVLVRAIEMHDELEAIYFLSDGEPTSGAIVSPPAIVDAISFQNRYKQITIYTLGIDAKGEHRKFLEDLAERNHGEFFLIR